MDYFVSKKIISHWNLEVKDNNEVLINKKVNWGVLQGDSLSPLLFVLCLDTLSKRLNLIYPKVEIATNNLLFIDNLKLIAHPEDTLNNMLTETDEFFKAVGLEMNKDKSATNVECCVDKKKLLETQTGYK